MRKNIIIGVAVIATAIILALVFLPRGGTGTGNPADETAFIGGMAPIMAQVQNPAGADLADWRQKRAAMICATIGNLQINNWVGTVDKTDTSIAGGGILSVAVMPNVDFGTAPNIVSNVNTSTIITPDSPLFPVVGGLQVGQKIRFSGQLFASQPDCIQEASITIGGAMQNPLFITRFTSIAPLPHADN